MKGVHFTRHGAILDAYFFERSQLCLSTRGIREDVSYNVAGALAPPKSMWFQMGIGRLNFGKRPLGVLESIEIDSSLDPSLVYHRVKKKDGRRIVGPPARMELEPSDKMHWFEFIINPEARTDIRSPGFCLYLPPGVYLDAREII